MKVSVLACLLVPQYKPLTQIDLESGVPLVEKTTQLTLYNSRVRSVQTVIIYILHVCAYARPVTVYHFLQIFRHGVVG